MVVSPTYFGACADVAALAEVAHGRGVPLVVDEAWGAHLHFHPALPTDALASGADLVTSSTHKIVGKSLTQAAMLHLGRGGRIDPAVVDRCVSLVETTSPSGLLTGSLDAARPARPPSTAPSCSARPWRRSPGPARRSKQIPGLAVLDEGMVGRPGIAGWDPLRLSIDVRGTGLHRLPARQGRLLHEPASTSSSTRRTSSSRSSGWESRRSRPASAWSRDCARWSASSKRAPARPRREAGAAAALGRAGDDAARGLPRAPGGDPLDAPPPGRIAAEGLAAYPPGIPNVLPGERLTAETLDYIRESVAHGGYVRGARTAS